jgi:iron(III) transport system substrate-binding protein
VDWYKELRDYLVERLGSEARADTVLAAIGRNAVTVRGHTLMGQLHAAGEYKLAVNYSSRVATMRKDGAPLAWQPAVQPTIGEPNGAGVLESARHPAAAVLFLDWLLGEGQKIIGHDGRDPVRRDLATGGGPGRVIDFQSIAADQERWTQAYERMLAGAKPAPEAG